MDRKAFLEAAAKEHFDICIIGGGATGAGCALEAASRGLRTILVEKEDFAAGTSSKSTKLIHGGVRYLEQAVKKLSLHQYAMVRKALKERRSLLEMAPHATRPLALITPCRTLLSSVYYYIGLKLYDRISGKSNFGSSRRLSKTLAKKYFPLLSEAKLHSAVLYYDGQMDDQRLNLALVQTAAEKGAVCLNHFRATRFCKDEGGKLSILEGEDSLAGRKVLIRSKIFINACGPFSDAVRFMANDKARPRIRVSRGVHLLFPQPRQPVTTGLLIPETKDGRVIFVLPYGNYLLAGTTDEEVPLQESEFGPTASDTDYILGHINQYLCEPVKASMISGGFGGFRPLVAADENNTRDLVRDHLVELDSSSGLISILGGKWTTFRLMALDAINAAASCLQLKPQKLPVKIKLAGSRHLNKSLVSEVMNTCGISLFDAGHLVSKYGDRALVVAELLKDNDYNSQKLVADLPYTIAELLYVIENEMACTVKDVLNRRWGIELSNWAQTLQLIPPVGEFMCGYFDWNDTQKKQHIMDYTLEVKALQEAILQ